MNEVIFFDDSEVTTNLCSVGLALNSKAMEEWFKREIQKFEDVEITSSLDSEFSKFDDMDVLVLLRKNKLGGVGEIELYDFAKRFSEINPNGLVLFIVGRLDSEGKQMVEKLEFLGDKLLVASAAGKMGEQVMSDKLREVIEKWQTLTENNIEKQQDSQPTQLIQVIGAKGGCGVTSFCIQMAGYIAEQKYKVVIVEKKKSLQYFIMPPDVQTRTIDTLTLEELDSLQKKFDYIILDDFNDVHFDNAHLIKVLIIDGSMESIERAKEIDVDTIVWNQAVKEIMPKEVIEKELGRTINLVVDNDRAIFLQAAITGESVIPEIRLLF